MEQDDIIRGYRKYKNRPFVIEARYTYNDKWASENNVMFIYRKYHPTKIAAEAALDILMKNDKKCLDIGMYLKIIYAIIDKRNNEIVKTTTI